MTYGPDSWPGGNAPNWREEIPQHPNSFAYRILADKSTRKVGSLELLNSSAPMRRDSFLLLTPGKDGIFGTSDDVANFGN